MWAKNDTLAEVTSCEVSPSADDCTGCSFAVVTPGNDATPTGTTASKSPRVVSFGLRASLCEPRAIGSGFLATLPRIDHRGRVQREREREREPCSLESIRVYGFFGNEYLAGRRARSNSLAPIYRTIFSSLSHLGWFCLLLATTVVTCVSAQVFLRFWLQLLDFKSRLQVIIAFFNTYCCLLDYVSGLFVY